MRILTSFAACVIILFLAASCKSEGATTALICDTVCVKDSMKFFDKNSKFEPFVVISANNCEADSISWSYMGMGRLRQSSVNDLAGRRVKLNPAAVDCFINDTSYAWLSFNDCATGRGYLVKIPYSKTRKRTTLSSALNKFDKKFDIADGLIAYSDRGNLFAEDMATGKTALMTFGQRLPIDYDEIHESIDSVKVTATHLWAKVKIDKEWKVFEKEITLK